MLLGEELQISFKKKYGNMKKGGLKEFVDIINFEDRDMKENLLNLIDDETELIWYPGCGGDVSPCSVLERKEFEKNHSIVTSDKRIYIFTDPDQYKICNSAFGGQHKIYDCSVEDYSKKYKINKSCEINIVDDLGKTIISGYYDILSLGDKTCNIIYLKMTMQDYLLCCIQPFELDIKWLFYLKMESKGGDLFGLYEEYRIRYPKWICANRIEKFTKIRELATLEPMLMKDGTSCYIDEDRKNGCADVMFGNVYSDGSTHRKQLIELLEEINVLCRDDGKKFDKDKSQRVKVIKEKIRKTDYKLTKGKIFLLCHKKELSEYKDDVVLISTHIDCKQPDKENKGITKCFSQMISDNLLLGTYDNSITNTAILYLMMNDMLPKNVIVAFTGDEEKNSKGAIKVSKLLKKNKIKFKCIVLDVTDAGWDEQVDFTIENNFLGKKMGKKVISTVEEYSSNWIFVPKKLNKVPRYVNAMYVYNKTAEEDESWGYNEKKVKCFSLCIPVRGDMHSDDGVSARVKSFEKYIEVLQTIASNIK